jgi:hypothetical protein
MPKAAFQRFRFRRLCWTLPTGRQCVQLAIGRRLFISHASGSFVGHRVIDLATLLDTTKSHERFNAGETDDDICRIGCE